MNRGGVRIGRVEHEERQGSGSEGNTCRQTGRGYRKESKDQNNPAVKSANAGGDASLLPLPPQDQNRTLAFCGRDACKTIP